MKALKRLEELLNQKDERIEELEGELQEFQDAEEREWKWCIHQKLKKNLDGLPVPRMEMRAIPVNGNWNNFEWHYCLIYKHTLGDLIAVPMGFTRSSSSAGRPPVFCDHIDMPFRDGVHIVNDANQMGLPAFAIVEDRIEKVFLKDGKIDREHIKLPQ